MFHFAADEENMPHLTPTQLTATGCIPERKILETLNSGIQMHAYLQVIYAIYSLTKLLWLGHFANGDSGDSYISRMQSISIQEKPLSHH
jgi:hypothetical protein